jgi:micrococcal nuclease
VRPLVLIVALFPIAVCMSALAAPAGPSIALPARITGEVRKVVDGDSLHVVDTQGYLRAIRLSDVDAPEIAHGEHRPGQPFGKDAAAFLRDKTLNRVARLDCFDVDARTREDGKRRERYVCQVTVDGLDVNAALVEAGLAMVERWNPRYVRNRSNYAREDAARTARRGLWSQASPTPPWVWRRVCWKSGECTGNNPEKSLASQTLGH